MNDRVAFSFGVNVMLFEFGAEAETVDGFQDNVRIGATRIVDEDALLLVKADARLRDALDVAYLALHFVHAARTRHAVDAHLGAA